MDLRPFTKSDWYGFAGAEPFADDSDPLMGEVEVEVDGTPWTAIVVLDAVGLTFMVSNDEGGEVLAVNFEGAYAARALGALGSKSSVSATVLRAMPGATIITNN